MIILDGPMGTELIRRGIPAPAPLWSAHALTVAPDTVAAIHREYAAAGATVHTANTFRTKRRAAPDRWEALARQAVRCARDSVPDGHRVAGSIAPLEDCYRPDKSPPNPRPEHRELARVLADAGCDVLLCETFPHVGEGLVAVEEAVATGVETWAAFTAGPGADLLSPGELARACKLAADRGASAVLVNCTAARHCLSYVEAIVAELDVPVGVYANAGPPSDGMGWRTPDGGDVPGGPERYADLAAQWIDAGATIIGSCCGTGPATIAELARRFGDRSPR